MPFNKLHFEEPLYFLLLLFIPLVWALFFLFKEGGDSLKQLEKFIDKHLIPHLLKAASEKTKNKAFNLLIWSLVATLFAFALAGPRSNQREITTFTKDQSLVILLDLSESMNAQDVFPSRLKLAKQKIEDLLNLSKGVKIGLVAFAADPHMIAPMTDDKETIRHLLSSLTTDLVFIQGSHLSAALEMADKMLESTNGQNKAIAIISDGGFEDGSAIKTAKAIHEKGITLYTIGVGTLEGAPLKNRSGIVIKKGGVPLISKLEKEKFQEISTIGRGRYFDADHSNDLTQIFEDLKIKSELQQQTQKTQFIWEEQFYLFLLPLLPFFLVWFKRGSVFLLLFLMPTFAEASIADSFYNKETLSHQAFKKGEYEIAAEGFEDPYRKGVAYYKMGDYKAAEEWFRKSNREEVALQASYNLGNALAQQNKLEEAVKTYEGVLEKSKDHLMAKENLEIVKKMLEEQKKENPPKNEEKKDSKDQSEEKQDSDKGSDEKKDSSEKNEEEKQEKQNEEKANSQEEKQNSLKEEEKESKEGKEDRSEEELNADLWLDQIKNDQTAFLKNKFYLESKKMKTKEEINPW